MMKYFEHKKVDFVTLWRIAFFDSMTFNGKTGGSKMAAMLRPQIRKNPETLAFFEYLKAYKTLEAPYYCDKMSYSDFVQFAAAEALLFQNGTKTIHLMQYGRKDATEQEAKEFGVAPCPKEGVVKFKDEFNKRGFEDKEIVALSFFYSAGKFIHQNQKIRNQQAIVDNYFYTTILRGEKTHEIQ